MKKISAAERLRRFYQQFCNDNKVLVLINADPDALACAMAVKRLLWRRVASVTLAHINVIQRPDNLAMIRLLGIQSCHIDQIALDQFDRYVLVDSQPKHSERFATVRFDAIIDHHPDSQPTAPFVDIRPGYGANATILTEYLRAAHIKISARLATGLLLGIKTDTHNFELPSGIEDVRAFQFLFPHANIHLARKVERADLRFDFLTYFQQAIETKRIRKNRVFIYLGHVINPDVCVLIADFFMRVQGVFWSVIAGVYQDRMVIIFRNDGIRKNAGNVARQSFGSLGSAGGHKSMARAEILLENLAPLVNIDDHRQTLRWVVMQFEKRAGKSIAKSELS